jgi:hypothetical protein
MPSSEPPTIDPKQAPSDQNALKFAHWVKTESKRLEWHILPMGGPVQERMLKFWKLYRPMMWASLEKQGITKELAHVLDAKSDEAYNLNLKAGMYRTDAQEEAEKDWLLMEAEPGEDNEPLEEKEERLQGEWQDMVWREMNHEG